MRITCNMVGSLNEVVIVQNVKEWEIKNSKKRKRTRKSEKS